uniref:PH01B019A14.11 protein n=1 Tax=Phyllostachys edulis TaxID=38705 RepID=L0P2G0_PHYED|nr:PH01B019A14.11 [Phyllostachys edulis]
MATPPLPPLLWPPPSLEALSNLDPRAQPGSSEALLEEEVGAWSSSHFTLSFMKRTRWRTRRNYEENHQIIKVIQASSDKIEPCFEKRAEEEEHQWQQPLGAPRVPGHHGVCDPHHERRWPRVAEPPHAVHDPQQAGCQEREGQDELPFAPGRDRLAAGGAAEEERRRTEHDG